jgi:Co/Zn/Cd efflux system component
MKTEECKIIFVNRSEMQIDSAVFTINDYSFRIENIAGLTTKSIEVMSDSITLNNHDVTIFASLWAKGKIVKDASYYTDLGGALNPEYTLTLNKTVVASLE